MPRPSWLGRAARNRHGHAIGQASLRWRGGRRNDSARTRRKILISTQVSPHAERLRLTFNGWWQSSWWPRDEPRLDATLEDPVARSKLTHSQRQSIADMLADPWQNLGPERHARLLSLSES